MIPFAGCELNERFFSVETRTHEIRIESSDWFPTCCWEHALARETDICFYCP